MKTVKEVSDLTGISVRTLHYYDEIGLLKPTEYSEAGYRFYDEEALETLQQILFFREFDMPLKDIKSIMTNPDFDRNTILLGQRKMLELKKDRLVKLISGIDGILKGENKMDFTVFEKKDLEEMYQNMVANMTDEMKKALMDEWGEMEAFHEHYIKNASGEKAQKNYQKLVEWYGSKEDALDAATNPRGVQVLESCQQRLKDVMKKLVSRRDMDVTSFQVKEVIGEYGLVFKMLCQLKDEKPLMLEMAASYRNDEKMKLSMDTEYGTGTADFFAAAVEEFYGK